MVKDPRSLASTPIYLTSCALSLLLINEFLGGSKYVKPITKTLASVGFLYTGLSYDLWSTDQGFYIFIGLILSAAGDIMLLSVEPQHFQIGAFFFLLAHIMYCGAFITTGISLAWFLGSAVVIAPSAVVVHRYILPYTSGLMRKLVITYAIAISWMMAFASGSYGYNGKGWLLTAAFLFYVSDLFVARQRFIKRCFLNSLCGLTLYYTAQIMFAVSPSYENFRETVGQP